MSAPGTAGRPERARTATLVATGLAAAGIVGSVWRPTAPMRTAATTRLDDFPADVLALADAYSRPLEAAWAATLVLPLVPPLLLVLTGPGRRWVARIAGPRPDSPARGALVALGVAVLTTLVVLPVSAWVGLVHQARFGFRTQGLAGWLRDQAVAAGFTWTIAATSGALLVWLWRRWPRTWPVRLTIAGTLLTLVLTLAYPLIVQPLLLTTEPLEAGPVREEVEQVLDRAGLAGLPILVGDASRRTTRLNAFVVGLGPSRQVVLYDNLLELPPAQVAVIVGHELAHREHADIARGVLLGATGLLALSGALWLASRSRLAGDVGARGPADPRLVAVAALVAALGQLVALPVASLVSRRAEATADHRAIELSRDPGTWIATVRTFVVRDLADPEPPAWTTFLWGTHPSVGERIRAAVAEADALGVTLPDLADLEAAEADRRHPDLEAGS